MTSLRTRLEGIQGEAKGKQAELLSLQADEWLDEVTQDVVGTLLSSPETPSIEDLLRTHSWIGSVDDLSPFYLDRVEEIENILRQLGPVFLDAAQTNETVPDLDDLRKRSVVEVRAEKESLWRDVYDALEDRFIPREWWATVRLPSVIEAQDSLNRESELERDIGRLETEARFVEREIDQIQALQALGSEKHHLTRPMWIVIYLTAVGIVWPLAIMADQVIWRVSWWKVSLVGAFSLGLAAFLVYLYQEIHGPKG